MTRLLLDTHVALRWLRQAPLSAPALSALAERRNDALVSIASVWEVAIKESIGKLSPPENFADALRDEGFEILPITVDHTRAVRSLPWHHRDPFDRMLVAQAHVGGLTLVTRDPELKAYDVKVLEA